MFAMKYTTVQQILALRFVAENAQRKGKTIYNCFVDFQKAFDSIDQKVAWAVLQSYGVNVKLVRLLKDINKNAEAAVRLGNNLGDWFPTGKGTRQGDPISPMMFISVLERAMDGVRMSNTGINIHGIHVNNL